MGAIARGAKASSRPRPRPRHLIAASSRPSAVRSSRLPAPNNCHRHMNGLACMCVCGLRAGSSGKTPAVSPPPPASASLAKTDEIVRRWPLPSTTGRHLLQPPPSAASHAAHCSRAQGRTPAASSTCVCVCACAHVRVCMCALSTCNPPSCPPECHACLNACLHACMRARKRACVFKCVRVSVRACVQECVRV